MEQLAREKVVRSIYRLAGFGSRYAVQLPSTLALEILGPDSIVSMPTLVPCGQLCQVGAQFVIGVRADLSPERAEFTIAHELAHWYIRKFGLKVKRLEATCDYIAAGLQCPLSPFLRLATEKCASIAQLAFEFSVTQTQAALRIGEVANTPVVVIAPGRVHFRGPKFERQPVKKVRLTDEPGRLALVG